MCHTCQQWNVTYGKHYAGGVIVVPLQQFSSSNSSSSSLLLKYLKHMCFYNDKRNMIKQLFSRRELKVTRGHFDFKEE